MKIKEIKIKRINIIQNEDVYDINVRDNHNFFANNILVHNCAELPLSSHDSCRLGSINLNNVVSDPYSKSAKIDFDLLSNITRVSQRLMDDIVSLEEEKIKAIISKIKSDPEDPELKRTELNVWKKVLDVLLKGRRTGIGVLGLGDMLAKLGIKYGTKEATELVGKVFETIAISSYKESINLAKERGSFPIWNAEKESQNPFILRIINHFSSEEYNDYLKYGRRNIANLAVAPTGCVSEDTVILTDRGNISMKELFLINNIDIKDLRGLRKIWITPKNKTFVYDINGNEHEIIKLFWNGNVSGYRFKFKNNDELKTSEEHKVLVYIGDNKATWKEAKNIMPGDKIIKLKQ